MKRYRYGGKFWVGPGCAIFFGGCTAIFVKMILGRENFDYKGLHYEGATALYLQEGFAFFSALLCLMGLYITAQRFFGEPQFIDVTATDITIPKNLFRKKVTIRFADIVDLDETQQNKIKSLIIKTARDKGVVSDSNFNTRADYEEIVTLLISHINARKTF